MAKNKTQRASGTNADAVVTFTNSSTSKLGYLGGRVIWSYSADPTGGRLTVVAGATTLLDVDIPKGGPGFLDIDGFDPPAGSTDNVVATLYAGGSGIVGKLNVAMKA